MSARLASTGNHGTTRRRRGSAPAGQVGAVLLEVILALALFVAAAAIVSSGISASMDSVERQRLDTHAMDLAISIMSEVQMGLRSPATGGPQAFDAPFEQWTWEVQTTPMEAEVGETSSLTRVEVIIRHKTTSHVQRLAQILPLEQGNVPKKNASANVSF